MTCCHSTSNISCSSGDPRTIKTLLLCLVLAVGIGSNLPRVDTSEASVVPIALTSGTGLSWKQGSTMLMSSWRGGSDMTLSDSASLETMEDGASSVPEATWPGKKYMCQFFLRNVGCTHIIFYLHSFLICFLL